MTLSATETVKLPTWRSQNIPLGDDERAWLRHICVRAVFSTWSRYGRPASLLEIYQFYLDQLPVLGEVLVRSKRTVDRRVNEAASPQHGAKIVAVTSGIYQPNPSLFREGVA